MIEFVSGDMFARPFDVRVNTVNTQGVMGAGVALAFKKRYPEMFEDYRIACKEGIVKPGHLHIWKNLASEWIINFPTKRDWRDPSRYEDIESGLRALNTYLRDKGAISVALPALGCGNGGLDWDIVSEMIQVHLADTPAKIHVFEPADSHRVGSSFDTSNVSPSQVMQLEKLGFKAIGNNLSFPSNPIWLMGDPELVSKNWLVILASKEPTEREFSATESVAEELAVNKLDHPVALIYKNHLSERIAEAFVNHGLDVVMILPFGPLTRPTLTRPRQTSTKKINYLSVASPNEVWSRSVLSLTDKFVAARAGHALITDAAPLWLNARSLATWIKTEIYYLFYGRLPDEQFAVLQKIGAKRITRREPDGKPDISALLGGTSSKNIASEQQTRNLTFTLEAPNLSQLRTLTAALRRAIEADSTLKIEISTSATGPVAEQELRAVFEAVSKPKARRSRTKKDSVVVKGC